MGHHCCSKQKVKRGLWSPEEDEKLIKHITTHGHGCWSSVPKLAGLQRCGKSCRLRWINYLRPDLKRGCFTEQEERIIIDVHRILGNRWAQIAKHLPGRTDNEVKNFWNSCIKKKLIAQGLDPNTHNLLSNGKLLSHTQNQQTNSSSAFSITSRANTHDASVDTKTPFLTLPSLPPPEHTNSIDQSPLYEKFSTVISTTFGHQNCPTFAPTVKNHQSAHSLIEFSTQSCNSLNPSGLMGNVLDESCMWNMSTAGLEHFEETKPAEVMQPQQQQSYDQLLMKEKAFDDQVGFDGGLINNEYSWSGAQNMDTSLIDCSNFDYEFVESALMPCGMYCNASPLEDQLAWDC